MVSTLYPLWTHSMRDSTFLVPTQGSRKLAQLHVQKLKVKWTRQARSLPHYFTLLVAAKTNYCSWNFQSIVVTVWCADVLRFLFKHKQDHKEDPKAFAPALCEVPKCIALSNLWPIVIFRLCIVSFCVGQWGELWECCEVSSLQLFFQERRHIASAQHCKLSRSQCRCCSKFVKLDCSIVFDVGLFLAVSHFHLSKSKSVALG